MKIIILKDDGCHVHAVCGCVSLRKNRKIILIGFYFHSKGVNRVFQSPVFTYRVGNIYEAFVAFSDGSSTLLIGLYSLLLMVAFFSFDMFTIINPTMTTISPIIF